MSKKELKTIGGRFLQIALTLIFLSDFAAAQKTLTAEAVRCEC